MCSKAATDRTTGNKSMNRSLTTTSLAPKNTGQNATSQANESNGHLTTQPLAQKNLLKNKKLTGDRPAKDSKAILLLKLKMRVLIMTRNRLPLEVL
jgi:hypothetical protein